MIATSGEPQGGFPSAVVPLDGAPAVVLDFDPFFPLPALVDPGPLLLIGSSPRRERPTGWEEARYLDWDGFTGRAAGGLPEQALVITIESCRVDALAKAALAGVRRFHLLHSRGGWVTTSRAGLAHLMALRAAHRRLERRVEPLAEALAAWSPVGLLAEHRDEGAARRAVALAGTAPLRSRRPAPTAVGLIVPGAGPAWERERVLQVASVVREAGLSLEVAVLRRDEACPALGWLQAAGLPAVGLRPLARVPERRGARWAWLEADRFRALARHPDSQMLLPLLEWGRRATPRCVHAWGRRDGVLALLAGAAWGAERLLLEAGAARDQPLSGWGRELLGSLADRVVLIAPDRATALAAEAWAETPAGAALECALGPGSPAGDLAEREWGRAALGVPAGGLLLLAERPPRTEDELALLIGLPALGGSVGVPVRVVVNGGPGAELLRLRRPAGLEVLREESDLEPWEPLIDARLVEPGCAGPGIAWDELQGPEARARLLRLASAASAVRPAKPDARELDQHAQARQRLIQLYTRRGR